MSHKAITIAIVLAICLMIGSTVYYMSKPRIGESFTEFYILGPQGKAENYPREVTLGDSCNVTMGISNHEGRTMTYTVSIVDGGEEVRHLGPITLGGGEKWEQIESLVPRQAGPYSVGFLLYIDGVMEPYRTLNLLIRVRVKAPGNLSPPPIQ